MSNKTIVFLVLLFISPLIIYLLWPSDINRIKKLFKEGAKAIEAQKVEDVMSKVSYNYSDEHGMTYIILREGMEKSFRELKNIKVEYDIKNIDVKDKKASAELEVRIVASRGQDTGYIVGDAGKASNLRFHLEKERTTWLVVKTEGLKLEF